VHRVLLLPQRHPVHLAKELATLDVLCGGRLRVGVGVGHLEAEMAAMDAVPQGRQARAIESLAVMRALWARQTDFDGESYSYAGVDAYPLPVHPGGPPIVMAAGAGPRFAGPRATPRAGTDSGSTRKPSPMPSPVSGLRPQSSVVT
jgi:alkanesulfonate monooxygenase SsuD/methylene tetrahydromethanopterin reductase-like flavin-dependent oxidoreductase (luciferase family)